MDQFPLEMLSLVRELCTRDHYADVQKRLTELQWAAEITRDERKGTNEFGLMRFLLDYIVAHGKTPPDLHSFRMYLVQQPKNEGALTELDDMSRVVGKTPCTDIDQLIPAFIKHVRSFWLNGVYNTARLHLANSKTPEEVQKFIAKQMTRDLPTNADMPLEAGEYIVSTASTTNDADETITTKLIAINGADIQPVAIDWWWEDRFALGKIAWLAGLPGTGKTTVMLDTAARITTGREFPDGAKNTLPPSRVMIAMSEDGLADTVVPRLRAAGANMKLITFLDRVTGSFENRTPNLQDDIAHLRNALTAEPDTRLLIMDPMTSYFGADVNINVDKEARPIMTALKHLCEEFNIGFMGVIHNNKQNDANAIQKILGCSSIVGAARSVYGCTLDPDDKKKRYFTFIKGNCSAKTSGIEYGVDTSLLDGKIKTAVIKWGAETEDTAEDVMKRERDARYERKEGKQTTLAQNFLPFFLKGKGQVFSRDIYTAAEAEGISAKSVNAAVDKFFSERIIRKQTREGWTMRWIEPEPVISAEVF